MMEHLRKLKAQLEAFLSRLSQRERMMVTAAAGAVVLFAVFLFATQISRAISTRESRVEQKTQMLSQIGKLTQGYRQAQAERAALEARLKGQQVQLMSFVSQTGARLGVEVNDLRPGTAGTGAPSTEGLIEESVEVNLARIDLRKLASLLENLERGAGIVKVRRIRVSTRSDDPALVDVTLLIATYRLKG